MGLDEVNETIGRGVMGGDWLFVRQLRLDGFGQSFAQFNTENEEKKFLRKNGSSMFMQFIEGFCFFFSLIIMQRSVTFFPGNWKERKENILCDFYF